MPTYFRPRNERAHAQANAGREVQDYCAHCNREFMEHTNGRCPGGPLPAYHSAGRAGIQSVKDVRDLCVCTHCGGLARRSRMITMGKDHAHGRCYLAVHGEEQLLALPWDQLSKLTLDDIGSTLMHRLLDKKD